MTLGEPSSVIVDDMRNYGTNPRDYYTRLGYSVDQVLDLPCTFDLLVDIYFALDEVSRQQFCRAAYWYQFAKESRRQSYFAAFVGFVSAIEALKDGDPDDSIKCLTCKQRTGPGPTTRFVSLLDRLVPEADVSGENRRAHFALRSALTHGDKLLQDDISLWHMGVPLMDERQEPRTLSQIVQASCCKVSKGFRPIF